MRTAARALVLGRTVVGLLALWSVAPGCQVSPQHSSALDPPRTSATRPTGPIHDLSRDESAGGHTLRKHVGRNDEQLRERLQHERSISAASSWTDRETAERAVGLALEQNREKIDRWRNREGGHPNLVIDYESDRSHPIGRSLRRDADQPEPCTHATIVLRWTSPNDYYVLTSYPECRG